MFLSSTGSLFSCNISLNYYYTLHELKYLMQSGLYFHKPTPKWVEWSEAMELTNGVTLFSVWCTNNEITHN